MKVMYDLSAFSDMVERQALDRLTSARRAIAYASFSFLEELAPLRKQEDQFNEIIEQYCSITWGRIVLPWSELVTREAETGRPVTARRAVLPSDDYQEAINLLREGAAIADTIGQEVSQKKQRYEDGMNRAAELVREVLRERGHGKSEIKKGFADWLRLAPEYLQDWGDVFHRHRPRIDVTRLPHLMAYLGYFFVKHYQSMNQERSHRGSDLYDQGYYIESTTLGNLITCDRDLFRTAELVPESRTMVHDGRVWTNSQQPG